MDSAKYVFPAVRGIQANMQFFITMIPLHSLGKIFVFNNEELPRNLRAQRVLNKTRIPELRDYILRNPTSYIFSALTASVDGDIDFMPIREDSPNIGTISISLESRLLLNDGQHRRAAIIEALKVNPDLRYEHIPVVLYHDIGLEHAQQMFSDLNRYAIRPTQSLNILYDNRNQISAFAKGAADQVPYFHNLVDMEHTSISNRSRALFTLSAIFHGTKSLLTDLNIPSDEAQSLVIRFWTEVGNNIPEWDAVQKGASKAVDVRQTSLSPLSITLRSLGEIGNMLLKTFPDDWQVRLKGLAEIDWYKNSQMWQNGIVVGDSVTFSRTTQKLMVEKLKEIVIG